MSSSPATRACTDIWRVCLESCEGSVGMLDTGELARLRRMRSASKRREFLVGRSALRQVLGRQLGVAPGDVAFAYGEHGKPRLVAGGPHFNLSHSGDVALIAVSLSGPVGVDVEQEIPGRPFKRLAERFFAGPETESFRRQPDALRRGHFYRLWTLKEAYLKAIGTGLTVSSRGFVVDADCSPPELNEAAAGFPTADVWKFHDLNAGAGYAAALCAPGATGRVVVRDFEPD